MGVSSLHDFFATDEQAQKCITVQCLLFNHITIPANISWAETCQWCDLCHELCTVYCHCNLLICRTRHLAAVTWYQRQREALHMSSRGIVVTDKKGSNVLSGRVLLCDGPVWGVCMIHANVCPHLSQSGSSITITIMQCHAARNHHHSTNMCHHNSFNT